MPFIEKYRHSLQKGGPGSQWHSQQQPIINTHKALVPSMFYPRQYHVIVKYAYARSFVLREDLSFWGKIYDKMQTNRCGRTNRKDFDDLISSIKTNGYDRSLPIPVSKTGFEILDGSHRLGACLALDLWPNIEVYDARPHSYDREWFAQNGFITEELQCIDKQQDLLLCKLGFNKNLARVGIVWGNALDYWDEILLSFQKHNLKIGIWINLQNRLRTEQFVVASYTGDGMNRDHIIDKSQRLAKMSTLVGIFVIEDEHEKDVMATKRKIREVIASRLAEYFFDSILHIIDSRSVGLQLLDQYLYWKG